MTNAVRGLAKLSLQPSPCRSKSQASRVAQTLHRTPSVGAVRTAGSVRRVARALGALVLAAAATAPTLARAQTMQVTFQNRGDGIDPHYIGVMNGEGINIADCAATAMYPYGMTYSYSVTTTNAPSGSSVYFYVGDNCYLATQRSATGPQVCFQIAPPMLASSQFTVPLTAQNILTAVNVGTPGCPANAFGSVPIWFLLMTDTTADITVRQSPSIQYDLQPPAPPGCVSTGAGDGQVQVTWTPPSTENITSLNGFNVYCEQTAGPAPPDGGTDAGGDASVSCEAGGGTGVGTDSCAEAGVVTDGGLVCMAGCMTSGADPATAPSCGSAGQTATSFWVQGLSNYANYNFAVATIDGFNNTSVLSTLVCGEPREVTDFWEAYCQANGRACQGAGCSATRSSGGGLSSVGLVGGTLLCAAVLLLLLGGRRRDRG